MWRFYAQLYDFLAQLHRSRKKYKELLNKVSYLHRSNGWVTQKKDKYSFVLAFKGEQNQ